MATGARDPVAQPEGLGALPLLLEVREADPFATASPLLRCRVGRQRPAEVDSRLLEDLGTDLVAPREALIDQFGSTGGVHGEAAPGIFRAFPVVPPVDERVPRPRNLDVGPGAAFVNLVFDRFEAAVVGETPGTDVAPDVCLQHRIVARREPECCHASHGTILAGGCIKLRSTLDEVLDVSTGGAYPLGLFSRGRGGRRRRHRGRRPPDR